MRKRRRGSEKSEGGGDGERELRKRGAEGGWRRVWMFGDGACTKTCKCSFCCVCVCVCVGERLVTIW